MDIVIPKIKFLPFIWLYYPFAKEDINKFNDFINWNLLSSNETIKWDYYLIKEFEDYWNWDALKDNRSVFRNVSLHLLFTEKVKPINCFCERELDNCDCVTESDIWKYYYRSKADKYFDFGYEDYDSNLEFLRGTTKQFIGIEQLEIILKMDSEKNVSFNLD